MLQVFLQELVASEVNPIDCRRVIGVHRLLGDLILIHLVALSTGQLVHIKVRGQERVKFVRDHLIEPLLWGYVLEIGDVSNLLGD